ncbi:MAG: hypothetical protein Q8M06_07445 [Methanobacteriaceae archaeon]|nr:hypothetical protein [Methanobacteriaceae archaeon]
MEIVKIEDFDKLLESIQTIFSDLDPIDYLKILKAEDMIKNQNKQMFRDFSAYLPFINDPRIKAIPMNRVFLDLCDYVDSIQIIIRNISPSYILLDLRCLLNPKASEELNSILNKKRGSIKKTCTNSKGDYNEYISAERAKEQEITYLRYLIKEQLIKFFSEHFEGHLIKKAIEKNDFSIVPSIDVFSLNLPTNDLKKWCENNTELLGLFSIIFSSDRSFNHNRYLLFKENKSKYSYLNHLIFTRITETNEEKSQKTKEELKREKIQKPNVNILNGLKKCSFAVIAIDRQTELEESSITKINEDLSVEMSNLEKFEIKELLKKRETLLKKIFEFERFKTEIISNLDNFEFCDFFSIEDSEIKFFTQLKNFIITKLDFLENITQKYSKYSQSNLDLKNIEYTQKSQERIFWLTIIVGVLTFIQVLSIFKGSIFTSFSPFLSTILFTSFISPLNLVLFILSFTILIASGNYMI